MDVNGIEARGDFERIKARFQAKFRIGSGGGCWLWTDAPHTTGYGVISVPLERKTRLLFAHRLAYFFAYGPIPTDEMGDTLLVCHRCDTRLCVNPAHLFLGTDGDNMRDKTAKGRNFRPIGELSPMAKLSAAKVLKIREAMGADRRDLAREYGVNESTIRNVWSRKTWAHV